MTAHADQRELMIDQGHVGTALLAALLGFVATCVVAAGALATFWQVAGMSGWLLCLFVPVVFMVLLAGHFVFNWWERVLPRLWPSGRRLVLGGQGLTLSRRGRIQCQIRWEHPFTAVQWRMRQTDVPYGFGPRGGHLVLACQLTQNSDRICVFSDSSPSDWRRVPGWRKFALLEEAPSRGSVLSKNSGLSQPKRRLSAPSHRGVTSMVQGDPKVLWPAELGRRRGGLALLFEDFCAVMDAVEQSRQQQIRDD